MKNKELTYSGVMRDLNKSHREAIGPFMMAFRDAFLQAKEEGLDDPESLALMNALKVIKKSSVFAHQMIRYARSTNPIDAGRDIARIITFMIEGLDSTSIDYRAILKEKLAHLHSRDIVHSMPESATLGQIITFVKTILAGSKSETIPIVLSSIVSSL